MKQLESQLDETREFLKAAKQSRADQAEAIAKPSAVDKMMVEEARLAALEKLVLAQKDEMLKRGAALEAAHAAEVAEAEAKAAKEAAENKAAEEMAEKLLAAAKAARQDADAKAAKEAKELKAELEKVVAEAGAYAEKAEKAIADDTMAAAFLGAAKTHREVTDAHFSMKYARYKNLEDNTSSYQHSSPDTFVPARWRTIDR